MIKLIADYGTYGLWILSTREAVLEYVDSGDFNLSSMSFLISALGVVWSIVRIVNSVLDGRINREQTRLENERLIREIYELEDYTTTEWQEAEDFRNERHK
jgi:cell shape-determining protein MreC